MADRLSDNLKKYVNLICESLYFDIENNISNKLVSGYKYKRSEIMFMFGIEKYYSSKGHYIVGDQSIIIGDSRPNSIYGEQEIYEDKAIIFTDKTRKPELIKKTIEDPSLLFCFISNPDIEKDSLYTFLGPITRILNDGAREKNGSYRLEVYFEKKLSYLNFRELK